MVGTMDYLKILNDKAKQDIEDQIDAEIEAEFEAERNAPLPFALTDYFTVDGDEPDTD